VHEFLDARKFVATARADDRQRTLPLTEEAALEQCRKVGDVIGMQMGDGDGIERLEPCFGFAEAQENAAAGIDQKPGLAVQPQQITRTGPGIVRIRASGTENLDRDGRGARRKGFGGNGQRKKSSGGRRAPRRRSRAATRHALRR